MTSVTSRMSLWRRVLMSSDLMRSLRAVSRSSSSSLTRLLRETTRSFICSSSLLCLSITSWSSDTLPSSSSGPEDPSDDLWGGERRGDKKKQKKPEVQISGWKLHLHAEHFSISATAYFCTDFRPRKNQTAFSKLIATKPEKLETSCESCESCDAPFLSHM